MSKNGVISQIESSQNSHEKTVFYLLINISLLQNCLVQILIQMFVFGKNWKVETLN